MWKTCGKWTLLISSAEGTGSLGKAAEEPNNSLLEHSAATCGKYSEGQEKFRRGLPGVCYEFLARFWTEYLIGQPAMVKVIKGGENQ